MLQNLLVGPVLASDRQFHNAISLGSLTGADVTGFNGYTVVTKIRSAENLVSGSRVRLILQAPNSANGTLSAIYFGEASSSGNAYDFASTPTQITFNGNTSLTLTAKKVFTSDPAVVDFNPSKAHIIAMNIGATTLRRFAAAAGTPHYGNVLSYIKAATSQAGTVSKSTGYTAQGNLSYCLIGVQAARTPDPLENQVL